MLEGGVDIPKKVLSPNMLQNKRRRRTTIEPGKRDALERLFQANWKPTMEEIGDISQELDLGREVVRVWFCNRRQRNKNAFSCGIDYGVRSEPIPTLKES